MSAKKVIIIVLVFVAGFVFFRKSKLIPEGGEVKKISGQNEAILKVEGMSCGSCVEKIKKALNLPGKVSVVSVSLARASASVRFDPSEITPEEITEAAALGGEYKTSLLKIKSENDLKEEYQRHKELSSDYAFAIDGEKIKKNAFEERLEAAMKPAAQGYGIKEFGEGERMQLISQVADKMILEVLIDREITKENIAVSNEEIENEIRLIAEKYKLTPQGLESYLSSKGDSPSSFRNRVERRVKLNKYLDMKVFPQGVPENKKGFLFNKWTGELRDKAQVEIYNGEIIEAEKYLETSGGCGNSCSS